MIDGFRWRGRGARPGLAALCLALLPAGALAEAAVTVSVHDQRVTVVAANASRRAILEALAAEGLLDVLSAEALEQRIDFDPGPLGLGDLLRRLLRQHSYTYLRQPGTDRLWVLARSNGSNAMRWRTVNHDVPRQVLLELTDPDPEVRLEAVLAAADLAPRAAAQLLLPAMHDAAPAVREAAEAVMEDLGATDYLPADRLSE